MKQKENNKKIDTMIPVNIRWISFSLFLFMIGWWLGWDTFFSVYIRYVLEAWIWVTLVWSLLPLVKLLVVIPVWIMNDQGNTKYLLLLWKLIYALSWCLYFLAWINHSLILLLLAVIANWIASSMMFTTYRTMYSHKGHSWNRSKIFGVYFSSINMAYVIWAIISARVIHYIELPYMYLFIVIFAMLSLLQDHKINDFIKKKFSKNWKNFEHKNIEIENELDEDIHNVKKLLWKRWVIRSFCKEVTSLKPWKAMFLTLKGYGKPMYIALANQSLVSFMNYVWFLFIPIISYERHLSLSQIAIIFAVMRLPYIINVFVWSIGDKYSKKLLLSSLMLLWAVIYFLLWIYDSFASIVVLSFLSSLVVALMTPVASALVSWYSKPKDTGMLSWLQEFVSRCWEIIWCLWFWTFANFAWMDMAFGMLWICLWALAVYLLIKKIIRMKTRDDEAKKEKMALVPWIK